MKVIQVENLSKQYRLGQIGVDTIRDDLNRLWARVRGKEDPALTIGQTNILIPNSKILIPKSNYVWALRDIDFSVEQGEVLGIIGKNGAGKSTLLKILSKVTAPTKGNVKVKGRIASLLEVGTGFHPELSGRDNIFLNGAILGMTKAEIRSKFDEIVDFSGVENYIDTPVKRYSSGMYVRLAFAVAAHLDPEILVVDEVLAVGDAEFQKKALGKMQDISTGQGRTVLFVSHNMAAISFLTNRCLWIDNGLIKETGQPKNIVAHYLEEGYLKATNWQTKCLNNNPIQIIQAEIFSENNCFDIKNDFKIHIDYIVREPINGAVVSAIIHSSDGASVLGTEDIDTNQELLDRRTPGKYRASVFVPGNWLSSGKYFLRLHSGVVFQSIFDNIEALSFELVETGNPKIRAHKQAYLLPYLKWNIEEIN